MSKSVVTQFQPSMSEWLVGILSEQEVTLFRQEDGAKSARLEFLFQTIGLPYERPEQFSAREAFDNTGAFATLLTDRGNELCALRLVPHNSEQPKLRNRGLTVRKCYDTWLTKQTINPDDYTLFVCPHSETLEWSATFVINHEAIFGEMLRGLHSQLTHGDTNTPPLRFRYDFKTWEWSERDDEAQRIIDRMIAMVCVPDREKQSTVAAHFGKPFVHDYLSGYFEVTVWPGSKIYFVDYNRIMDTYIATPSPRHDAIAQKNILRGTCAYPGVVQGVAQCVNPEDLGTVAFSEHAILVCDNTDIRYLPLMKQAQGIITNRGGVLSHAAIVARELHKPCVVSCAGATDILNGKQITLDASKGIVTILNEHV